MLLKGRTCLLTGASGGIGVALAQRLSAAGVRLLLSGRSASKLETLRQTLPDPGNALVMVADLADAQATEHLASQAASEQVSLLINLSGVNELCMLQDQTAQAIERILQINTVAPIQLTRLMLPGLKQQDSACVVNIGSAFGTIGYPGYATYSASKWALRGFTEALRRELADTNVDVLYIAPRATSTEMNDAAATALNVALGNQVDTPQWVADQIYRAIVSKSRSTTLGYPEKLFAKLNQLLPAMVDRALAKQLPIIKGFAHRSAEPSSASASVTPGNGDSHAQTA